MPDAGTAGIGSEPGAKIAGRLFERTILQQPGEQQVTLTQRFKTLLVALPIRLVMRQQRRALRLDEHRGDIEERARLLHVARKIQRAHIARNSSVISDNDTSVSSSRRFAIMDSSASKGPE